MQTLYLDTIYMSIILGCFLQWKFTWWTCLVRPPPSGHLVCPALSGQCIHLELLTVLWVLSLVYPAFLCVQSYSHTACPGPVSTPFLNLILAFLTSKSSFHCGLALSWFVTLSSASPTLICCPLTVVGWVLPIWFRRLQPSWIIILPGIL